MDYSARKLLIALIVTAFISIGAAQPSITFEEADERLNESRSAIQEMNETGIPTQRAEDLYGQAEQSYEAQLGLNESGEPTDLSQVEEITGQILEIRDTSIRVNDRIQVLDNRIQELEEEEENLNLSAAKNQLENAREEFRNQRFEESNENIDQAYQEISNARSAVTQAQAFYDATSDNLVNYIRNNTREIAIGSAIGILLLITGIHEFRVHRLRKRKNHLKKRKEVLQDLVEETQEKYFEKGDLSKSSFETRRDTYNEMIREVNEKLPVVREQLEDKTELRSMISG
jgi:ElaB/YqjD/DUF883 family membrane-anchored ribosome-binding protein